MYYPYNSDKRQTYELKMVLQIIMGYKMNDLIAIFMERLPSTNLLATCGNKRRLAILTLQFSMIYQLKEKNKISMLIYSV